MAVCADFLGRDRVGLATLLLVLVVVEILGRKTLGTRWTITFTAAFLWLDVMTYAAIALVRQVAWAV